MPSETSADIAARVAHAREMQEARFKDNPNIFNNAQMPSRMVREVCQISQAGLMLVKAISSNLCNYYAEGCIIALEKLGHQPGIRLRVEGVKSASFILNWDTSPPKSG